MSASEYKSLDEEEKNRLGIAFTAQSLVPETETAPFESKAVRDPVSNLFRKYDHLVVAESDRIYGSKRSTYIFVFSSEGSYQNIKQKFPGNFDQIKNIFLT